MTEKSDTTYQHVRAFSYIQVQSLLEGMHQRMDAVPENETVGGDTLILWRRLVDNAIDLQGKIIHQDSLFWEEYNNRMKSRLPIPDSGGQTVLDGATCPDCHRPFKAHWGGEPVDLTWQDLSDHVVVLETTTMRRISKLEEAIKSILERLTDGGK